MCALFFLHGYESFGVHAGGMALQAVIYGMRFTYSVFFFLLYFNLVVDSVADMSLSASLSKTQLMTSRQVRYVNMQHSHVK